MIYIGLFLAYMAGVITMCLFQINKDHIVGGIGESDVKECCKCKQN